MLRKYIVNLISWKSLKTRKPLILNGARQVGKTHLLEVFGKTDFPNFHVFNFEKNKNIHSIFERQKDPLKILTELSLFRNKKIDPDCDLIIFDEIQACPEAITSLKYFSEDLSQSYICAAGSLLGLHLGESSFPVGKVDFLKIFPLTFEEFITACGFEEIFRSYLKEPTEVKHEVLWNHYIDFLITGGLPEVVNVYLSHKEKDPIEKYEAVYKTQDHLILGYLADMAKHCGKENAMFLETIWRNSAEQLGQEKAPKYQFKGVFPGKRSYIDFMSPIDWLKKAGLLYQIPLIDSAKIPLSIQKKGSAFKLFVFDVGIMNHLSGLSWQQIINYDFNHKGFIAENFVLQELMATSYQSKQIFTYKSSMSEIEFLVEHAGDLLPIEVKAGLNLKAKSLSVFKQKYQIKRALRLSRRMLPFHENKLYTVVQDWPLFLTAQSLQT